MIQLDKIIRHSLTNFIDAINADKWTGRREREAICLYLLAHLQNEVRPRGVLYDVRQLGIEMPVKQISPEAQMRLSRRKGTPKAHVAKDLLIWPRPMMTTWNGAGKSQHSPLAIMEWKMGRKSPDNYDVEWLQEYSRRRPKFTGYAVSLFRSATGRFSIGVVRVSRGKNGAAFMKR